MVTEETLKELKCASSHDQYFFIKTITLPNCGHLICKNCVPKDYIQGIKCKLCGLISKQDFKKFQVSTAAQTLLKICIGDVFKILEADTSFKLNELKSRQSNLSIDSINNSILI